MKFLVPIILLALLVSCKHKEEEPVQEIEPQKQVSQDQLMKINEYWVKDEVFRIQQYIKRHEWNAVTTETGISYYIYEKGNGVQVEKDMVVTLDFEIRLMDADSTLCYTSAETGPQSFLVEMDNIESGLHEAVKYLHVGDKAYIILPHFAAHGLLGDMDKIPPLSAVIYNVTLLDAKHRQ